MQPHWVSVTDRESDKRLARGLELTGPANEANEAGRGVLGRLVLDRPEVGMLQTSVWLARVHACAAHAVILSQRAVALQRLNTNTP